MSTNAVTSFAELVTAVVKAMGSPSPPPGLVLSELYDSAICFCRRAECWQELLAPIAAVSGQAIYPLTTAYDARVQVVKEVRLDGFFQSPAWYTLPQAATLKFYPAQAPRVSTVSADFSASVAYAARTLVKYTTDGRYYRNPVALAAGEFDPTKWQEDDAGLQVMAVLVPTLGAITLPSWFFDRWGDAFVSGAVANLKCARGPYQDMAGLRTCQVDYENAINSARLDTMQGHQDGPLTFQFRGIID